MRGQTYRVLAVVPYLRSEKGHYHSFHLAAADAAKALGWDYIVAAPLDADITDWPHKWIKCLDLKRRSFRPRWLARYYEKHAYRTSLTRFLRDNLRSDEVNILFLEDPTERQLRLLTRSLMLIPTANLSVWLHWHSSCNSPAVCQWVKRLATFSLTKDPVLTAMTEPLAREWGEGLGVPVRSIPHPAVASPDLLPAPRTDDLIQCWWPGPPYQWKGLDCIQHLLDLSGPEAARLKVLCSSEASISAGKGSAKLQYLPPTLKREDYLQQMVNADLILLPYHSNYCMKRFSGILLEAIQLGKIPVVREGTWMAQELEKYELGNLIVDWSSPNIASKLVALATDPELPNRVAEMQAAYKKQHCSASFSETMFDLHNEKEIVVPFPSSYILNDAGTYPVHAVD